MLEYFTYKKIKKNQEKKLASQSPQPQTPVLSSHDEEFLQRILSEEGPAPVLPPRYEQSHLKPMGDHKHVILAGETEGNKAQMVVADPANAEVMTPQPGDEAGDHLEREMTEEKGKGKQKEGEPDKKTQTKNKLGAAGAFLGRTFSKREKTHTPKPRTKEDGTIAANEAEKEKEDITIALDNLSLAADGVSLYPPQNPTIPSRIHTDDL
jgi:hypothetical protein